MHTVKLYEHADDAVLDWDKLLTGGVAVFVSGESMSIGNYQVGDHECRSALLHLTNGTAVHMIASGTETTILPRFDVAWFDGVEPPEWLGDMAKPGAVVLLSRQPKEGSGAA